MRPLFLFLLLSTQAFAANEECIRNLGLELSKENAQLQKKYLEIDDEEGEIREGNEAVFLPGKTDKAAIVIHGFSASPFEVQELGKALHERGATVYMPLLPGFGASADVANQFGRNDWKNALTSSLEKFAKCFSEITLSGFSTGGTTVTNYLLLQNPVNGIRVKRAALLSPYLESDSEFGNILNVVTSLFSGSIPVQDLYDLSHNPDLQSALKNPQYYNADLPLKAARQVVLFGRELRADLHKSVNSTPIYVAYSFADQTIEAKNVAGFYKRYFTNVEFHTYAKELGIPHQITVPNINPNALDLVNRVANFLLSGDNSAEISSEEAEYGAPETVNY